MNGLYAVPWGVPFLPTFVKGLIEETASNPLTLATYLIIMPTHRGCLELHHAFQSQTLAPALVETGAKKIAHGRILPRIVALTDIEEGADLPGLYLPDSLPPAIPPWRRVGILAKLISAFEKQKGWERSSLSGSLTLAHELIKLIDEVETAGLDLANLKTLVGTDYATHWQLTLDFLHILIERWPDILKQEELLEPAARRRMILEQIAMEWNPQFPVILAGTTGSRQATVTLMRAILKMKAGKVVLPGIDPWLIREEGNGNQSNDLFGEDDLLPSHPQYTLSRLIKTIGRPSLWPLSKQVSKQENNFCAKTVFLSRMLFSASGKNGQIDNEVKQKATRNLEILEADTVLDEAQQIALIMRQELETPNQIICLITPDTDLTLRVQAALGRWNIFANVARGKSLSQTFVGRFLLSSAALTHSLSTVELLGLLKHPLYAKAKNRLDHLHQTRRFEMDTLRASKGWTFGQTTQDLPFPGHEQCVPLLRLNDGQPHTLLEFLETHQAVAENMTGDAALLWGNEDGQTAATLWQALKKQATIFPPLTGRDYPLTLRTLMDREMVRDGQGTDSRLLITGTREARFLNPEVVILGGLNEGVWPHSSGDDPWLSRAMREKFGLPSLEQNIGLSAHDFCMAFAASKVYMTRSLKRDGTPTLPSRWWQRFKILLETNHDSFPCGQKGQGKGNGGNWATWAWQIDQPPALNAFLPPAACPPLSARPRCLSVTSVETLMRDPYSLYAKKILKLRPLNDLDTEVSLADRGQVIHYILEMFIRAKIDVYSPEAIDKFTTIGRAAFQRLGTDPRMVTFWQPRLLRLGQWFIDQMKTDSSFIQDIFIEEQGTLDIVTAGGSVMLTAKADRIDKLALSEGRIIDYKTGTLPDAKSVMAGHSPQLPLEALILKAGGFPAFTPTHIKSLCYWKMTGGTPAGEIRTLKNVDDLTAQAEQGIQRLFDAFLNRETPFYACPDSAAVPAYHDYAHLERLKEWA
jgi:ATP-dependent helicase/nuclease subunit B